MLDDKSAQSLSLMNTDYFFEFLAKVERKLVNCKQEALLQRSNSLYSELVCVGLQHEYDVYEDGGSHVSL